MAATYPLKSANLRAEISDFGAQLVRLQDAEGRDLLWDGNPDIWANHAPLLFPIVGKVADDHLNVDGTAYPIRQHGVARISQFELIEASTSRCGLRLTANDETRKSYPFDFVLDVVYALDGAALTTTATVTNPGRQVLPVSFGFHPAFRWPLPYGRKREDHAIRFEHAEPAPIRRLKGGLMEPELYATPVEGDVLWLRDDLFIDDAVIMDQVESRGVSYGARDGPAIRVSFEDMPQLGIWTKVGAEFVCIEPWQGYASPIGFDGELRDKPGMLGVLPGDTVDFSMRIELIGA